MCNSLNSSKQLYKKGTNFTYEETIIVILYMKAQRLPSLKAIEN